MPPIKTVPKPRVKDVCPKCEKWMYETLHWPDPQYRCLCCDDEIHGDCPHRVEWSVVVDNA